MNNVSDLIALRDRHLAKAQLINELLAELGQPNSATNHVSTFPGLDQIRPKRSTMSQASRERLAAVARARWKKAKAQGKKAL